MNEDIQNLINRLIQIEHVSSTLYLAMSAYMDRINYTGMASWLRAQSNEERTHMLVLIDYLNDKGGTVKLEAVPAQQDDFGSPLQTFKQVLAHEQYVTNGYRRAYNFAVQADPQAAVIINDFLREQIEEESQSQRIVDRLALASDNPAALLVLDQELGQRINGAAAQL
ncbi:ferritin [Bacillus marinisedimentorum]|uniref:ferritin n=1 Tax=Bacillus marinisedimentorum TaxID=1821260 RepID=UPI0007E10CDF|nr:ferritin [Bacillus marinisedimentorum]